MSGSAIVVGAGIGGLAAAIGLRRIGWDVTVLERSPEVGEIGAGMSQAPNALRALDALGVGDRARAAGTPFFATTNLRDPSCGHLMSAPSGARIRCWASIARTCMAYSAMPFRRSRSGQE